MARVVIPAKTKKLVANSLTKLAADMETLTVKNPAAIAQFRAELTSTAQLLSGLSTSLESLVTQLQSAQSASAASASERATPKRQQVKDVSGADAPSPTPQPEPESQPPKETAAPKTLVSRGRKKVVPSEASSETQPSGSASEGVDVSTEPTASGRRKKVHRGKK